MKVLYFAWLRERLNCGEEYLAPPESVKTVSDLLDWIGGYNEGARLAFEKRELIKVAVDEIVVEHNFPIDGARTIALFPPMTGG